MRVAHPEGTILNRFFCFPKTKYKQQLAEASVIKGDAKAKQRDSPLPAIGGLTSWLNLSFHSEMSLSNFAQSVYR
jgi:hypothetical protein